MLSLLAFRRYLLPVLILTLCLAAKAGAQQQSARTLEPDQTLPATFLPYQGTIKPPDQIYYFTATKGDYVEVRAQQEGCDVQLQILAPNGKAVATLDSYNGGYGPECWRGIMNETGQYRVYVRYISQRGTKADYNITLAARRKATDADQKRAKAQELYIQAWQRRQNQTQHDSEQAYFLYEKASELYRDAEDTLGEAQSLESAAALGTPVISKSLRVELYQTALFLFRRLRERSGEATALHSLGTIYADMKRSPEAIAFYQQALEAHHAIGDSRSEAIALNNLALVYCGLKQPQEALRYFQKALTACRQTGDRDGEAALLKYIGDIYDELGQSKEATRYYKQSEAVKK
jgi:tetratricopeptide (TPR) repeat protein